MRIKQSKQARVGIYSAGLQAYWTQFEGLQNRLLGYNRFIAGKVSQWGEVYNFGLVDNEKTAREAGEYFNAHNVDILLVHSATYFTSASVLPVHQLCKAPAVMLNLQPAPAMAYEATSTGEWLAQCVGCPVPEAANAFARAGIELHIINGLLGLEETPKNAAANEATANNMQATRAWAQIEAFIKAAGVKRTLQFARFGFLGNNYSGMLDMYSDFAQLQAKLGLHVELLEMCDLDRFVRAVTPEQIREKQAQVAAFFQISEHSSVDPLARKPTQEQLEWACKIAAAQEAMALAYDLDALAYYYHGADDNHYERVQGGFIVGHSLLTAGGIPCAGEGDIKTGIAMKICDTLSTGGSFIEIVAMDYEQGTMLLGHDGPFHIKIADGKPVLRGMGVYHGKRGSGVSVEASVITGPVTTLGLTQLGDGRLRFITSQGIAKKHPILAIGNTQTHVDFGMDLDAYMDEWFRCAPTHHCALSVGHNAALFEKVAKLLEIECVRVGKL